MGWVKPLHGGHEIRSAFFSNDLRVEISRIKTVKPQTIRQHERTKEITLQCRSASPTDRGEFFKPSIEKGFLSFAEAFCPILSIYGTANQDGFKAYNKPAVPVIGGVQQSIHSAIACRTATHTFTTIPACNGINDRSRVVGFSCASDLDFEGFKHLRIEHGDKASIWAVTDHPMNRLEAYDAAFWLVTKLGYRFNLKTPLSLWRLAEAPLPLVDTATEVTLVEGPIIKFPRHAQRFSFLKKMQPPGWYAYHDTESNRALQFAWEDLGKAGIFSPYEDSIYQASCLLAMGEGQSDVIELIANELQNSVPKFKKSRERAIWQSTKLVNGIVTNRPTVVGSRVRKEQAAQESIKQHRELLHSWRSMSKQEKLNHFKHSAELIEHSCITHEV